MKQTLQKIIAVILLLLSAFIIQNSTFAQNVGISATGTTPDNSAMLDVVSTTKGMLIPRVSLTSLTDAATITTPATSLLVYNTNAALSRGTGYYYNAGTTVSPLWVKLLNTGAGTAAADAWLTKGNSGTSASNFLGTTDNVSLRMRTNNTTRVIVDSLGKVGIGLTTPAYKLDILDSNSAGSGVTSTTLNVNQIRTEANITATTTLGINSTLLYRMTEGTPGTQGFGYAANNTVYTDGTYTFNQLRGATNTAYTNSTATANQNTLMGAVNTGQLNSSGTLNTAYGTYNQALNNSSGTMISALATQNYVFMNSGATGAITTAFGSNTIVANNSTVGGSIATAYGLNSYIGKAATASAIGTGYLYYGSYGAGAATKHYGIYITGEDTNYFSGKVGIGTASPSGLLHVNSPLAGGTIVRIGNTNVGGKDYFIISTGTGNTEGAGSLIMGNFTDLVRRIVIRPNGDVLLNQEVAGNVGIGCTAPQYKLHVVGNVGVVGTIYATVASVTSGVVACSDIRYKKDITPLSNTLNNVMKLQGVNYLWKTKEFPDKNFSNEKQIGFIAQEIEKIYPEVVMTDKDGYKSVDYSRLTPILVEAIKELKKENDSLKAENELRIQSAELKAKESELRIAKLETAMNLLLQQSARAEIK